MPAPQAVKEAVFLRHAIPRAPWIETGTYRAVTTMFLARHFDHVTTIEPSAELHKSSHKTLSAWHNVTALHGLSETLLPATLAKTSGNMNCWLDGH